MKIILSTLFVFSCMCLNSFGQVAGYSFNNGTAADDIGSNDGIVSGATPTVDRFGNANHAFSFDGIDDYIDYGDQPEFQMGNGDFSISIWFKYDSAQQANLISKRSGSSQNFSQYNFFIADSYQFGGVSKKMFFFSRTNPTSDRPILVNTDLSGAWHHAVIVCSYTDSTSVFIDGQFAASNATPLLGHHDVIGFPLVMGYSSELPDYNYNGSLDDVLIYDIALSAQQVDSLYNLPDPNSTTGINSTINDSKPEVYPNPSNGTLNIKNASLLSRIEIMEVTGKILIRSNETSPIDISNLENGVYLLRLFDQYGVPMATQKVVKE